MHGLPGRCLLSGYINKRDPNQGTCTNACRWEYNVAEGKEDDVGNIVHKYEPIPVQTVEPTLGIGAPTDKVFMIEEAKRPGEYMTAFEDEHGTYIMNSKDLRAIAHVERPTQMGVHSLKIEGRTKSFYYSRAPLRFTARRSTMPPPANRSIPACWRPWRGWPTAGTPKASCAAIPMTIIRTTRYGYPSPSASSLSANSPESVNGPLAAVAVKK